VLTQLPGIDEDGAASIKAKAAELVSVKATEDEERAQREAEDIARMQAEQEALSAQPAPDGPREPPVGPAADRNE